MTTRTPGRASHLDRLRDYLNESYLALPLMALGASVAAGFALVTVDRRLQEAAGGFRFGGGPEAARAVLTTIAASMMTFTALVFSITILALQLTSNQFSPRALRHFLTDRVPKIALSAFVATFAFALTALAEVRNDVGEEPFVPGLTLTVAQVLVAASLVAFIVYINHMAQSLRVTTVISRIRAETWATMQTIGIGADQDRADDGSPSAPGRSAGAREPGRIVVAPTSGVIGQVGIRAAVEHCARHDLEARLLKRIGEFVPTGAPLWEVRGGDGDHDGPLVRHVHLLAERTLNRDPAFGFRQLVDIAERALSPGVNDPTTATQCLDALHELLRRSARASFPDGRYPDQDGVVRVSIHQHSWVELCELAFDETRHWGAGSLQVVRRSREILADLAAVTDGERQMAVERQRSLLERRAGDLHPSERTQLEARRGTTGIGT